MAKKVPRKMKIARPGVEGHNPITGIPLQKCPFGEGLCQWVIDDGSCLMFDSINEPCIYAEDYHQEECPYPFYYSNAGSWHCGCARDGKCCASERTKKGCKMWTHGNDWRLREKQRRLIAFKAKLYNELGV